MLLWLSDSGKGKGGSYWSEDFLFGRRWFLLFFWFLGFLLLLVLVFLLFIGGLFLLVIINSTTRLWLLKKIKIGKSKHKTENGTKKQYKAYLNYAWNIHNTVFPSLSLFLFLSPSSYLFNGSNYALFTQSAQRTSFHVWFGVYTMTSSSTPHHCISTRTIWKKEKNN